MLIGGLMVQAHGMAAGIDVVRPTVDVDMIVLAQLRSDPFGETIQQLRNLGYEFRPPMGAGPAHRFVREQAQVDVGLPDNLGRSDQRRLQGRAVLQIDGGYQAAERVTRLEVAGCPVPMQVPDLLGALILKGAAYMVDRVIRVGICRTRRFSRPRSPIRQEKFRGSRAATGGGSRLWPASLRRRAIRRGCR
jgi:hypothetical protein